MTLNQFLLFLSFSILFPFHLSAQEWQTKANAVIPDNHRVWSIKMATPEVIWAISSFDAFPPPMSESPRIFRSTDGGEQWQSFSLPATGGKHGWDIWAADAETAFVAIEEKGIYKTTDGGNTWNLSPFSNRNPKTVYFFDENDGWVLGTDNNGELVMSITSDGGNFWTEVAPSNLPIAESNEFFLHSYAVNSGYDVQEDNIVVSTSTGSYWLSTDRGQSWQRRSTPLRDAGYEMTAIAMKDLSTIMVASDFNYFNNSVVPTIVYITQDGGQNWTAKGPGITPSGIHYLPDSEGTFVLTGHHDFGIGNNWGTSISYDYGDTWEMIDTKRLISIDFLDKNTGVAALGTIPAWETMGNVYSWDLGVATTEPLEEVEAISVSPNPFSNDISVLLPSVLEVEVTLFDRDGKVYKKENYHANNITVGGLKALPAGIYFLKVSGKAFESVQKVVKH